MSEDGYSESDPLVADAIALQRAVISDPSTVPVSADVVAQIVAQYASKSHVSELPSETGMSNAPPWSQPLAAWREEAGEVLSAESGDASRMPAVQPGDGAALLTVHAGDILDPPEADWRHAGHGISSRSHGSPAGVVVRPTAVGEEAATAPPHAAASHHATAAVEPYEQLLRDHARLQGRAETLAEEAAEATRDRAQLQAELAALRAQLRLAQQREPDAAKPTPPGGSNGWPADAQQQRYEEQQQRYEEQQQRYEEQQQRSATSAAHGVLQQRAGSAELEARQLREELSRVLAEAEQHRELATAAELEAAASAERAVAAQTALTSARAEVLRLGELAHQLDDLARRAEEEVAAVTSARDWYQQQLRATQEARSILHDELAQARGQLATQAAELERLRAESARARHELSATQQRALTEKQLLARQLELIEADMLEREAGSSSTAGHAELALSGTTASASHKVELAALQQQLLPSHAPEALLELQDEVQRWQHAAAAARAEADGMDAQRVELARAVEELQRKLVQREHDGEALQERLAEAESRLKSALKKQVHQEASVLKARQEKNNAEVALQLALDEKAAFSLALDTLKANAAKVEASFKQLRLELSAKQQQCDALQVESCALQKQLLDAAVAAGGQPVHAAVLSQRLVPVAGGSACPAPCQPPPGDSTQSRHAEGPGMPVLYDGGQPVCPTAVGGPAAAAGAAPLSSVIIGSSTQQCHHHRWAVDEQAVPAMESLDCKECQQSAESGRIEELARLNHSLEAAMEREQEAARERSLLEQRCSSLEASAAEWLRRIEELAAANQAAANQIQLLSTARADLEAQLALGNGGGGWPQCSPPTVAAGPAGCSDSAAAASATRLLPKDKPADRPGPLDEVAICCEQAQAKPPERSGHPTHSVVTLPDISGASGAPRLSAKLASQHARLAEGMQLLESMDAFASGLHVKMASLQQQLDAHSCAVRSSSESWKTVEDEIRDLQRVVHGDDAD